MAKINKPHYPYLYWIFCKQLMVGICLWCLTPLSTILWWSVLLVEETGVNCQPVAGHWQILSHNVVSCTSRHVSQVTAKLYHIMLYRVHPAKYSRSLTNCITYSCIEYTPPSIAGHWQTLSHIVVSITPHHVSQVADKLYHIILYRVHHAMYRKSLANFIT